MKAWALINRKTDTQVGIPFETMLAASKADRAYPAFRNIIKRKTLQTGEIYVPAKGTSPATA